MPLATARSKNRAASPWPRMTQINVDENDYAYVSVKKTHIAQKKP